MRDDDDTAVPIEFPLLEAETDLTTGAVRRYYVDIRRYNADLAQQIDQMSSEELDTLHKRITQRKKALKAKAKAKDPAITKAVTEKQKAKKAKKEKRKKRQ
jgi:hypothetical protein